MPNPDKYILVCPGGPAGPFWGIVTQSGRVIATQIESRGPAELLVEIGNIAEGDFDTVRSVGRRLSEIWKRDLQNLDVGSENYMVRAVVEALADVALERIK